MNHLLEKTNASTNPSGGRIRTPAVVAAEDLAAEAVAMGGLAPELTKRNLVELVEELGKYDRRYGHRYAKFVQLLAAPTTDADWRRGHPVNSRTSAALAFDLQVDVSTMRRYTRHLVELGIVCCVDAPGYRRQIKRRGNHVKRFGISLAPLIANAERLAATLAEHERRAHALEIARDQAKSARRTLLVYRTTHRERLDTTSLAAIAAHETARIDRMGPGQLEDFLGRSGALIDCIDRAVAADAPPSSEPTSDDRESCGKPVDIRQRVREDVTNSARLGGDMHQPQKQRSSTAYLNDYICSNAFSTTKNKSFGPIGGVSPAQVLALARRSKIGSSLNERTVTEPDPAPNDIIEVCHERRGAIGLSPPAWRNAIETIGPHASCVALVIAAAKADPSWPGPPVTKGASAYFQGIVANLQRIPDCGTSLRPSVFATLETFAGKLAQAPENTHQARGESTR